MLSNSAKSTSLAESRFRIAAPNSVPREIMVIAIGAAFADVEARLAKAAARNFRFMVCNSREGREAWRGAMADREVDAVVLLSDIHCDRSQISAIGSYCLDTGIRLATLLLVPPGTEQSAMDSLLADLRFWSHMLSIVSNPDDVSGMLQALGG